MNARIEDRDAGKVDFRQICAEVHASVKQGRWSTDMTVYGIPVFWGETAPASARGTCEDYVFAELSLLVELGLPYEDIFVQLCWNERNEYHVVLLVRLEDTDVILDYFHPQLRTPQELVDIGYRFDRHIRSDGEGGWRHSVVRAS